MRLLLIAVTLSLALLMGYRLFIVGYYAGRISQELKGLKNAESQKHS